MPVCLALAYKVDGAWLAEDLTWFSGAANREVRAPLRLLVTHFFNHQTHHRGQVHAMLTAAGQETGDTDLFLVVPEIVGRSPVQQPLGGPPLSGNLCRTTSCIPIVEVVLEAHAAYGKGDKR